MNDQELARYLLNGGTMPSQTMDQIYGFTGYPYASSPAPAVNYTNPMDSYNPPSTFNPNGFGDDPLRSYNGGTGGVKDFDTGVLGGIVNGEHANYPSPPAPLAGIPAQQVQKIGKTSPSQGGADADRIARAIFAGLGIASGALGRGVSIDMTPTFSEEDPWGALRGPATPNKRIPSPGLVAGTPRGLLTAAVTAAAQPRTGGGYSPLPSDPLQAKVIAAQREGQVYDRSTDPSFNPNSGWGKGNSIAGF